VRAPALLIVALITGLGAALRLVVGGQSMFADELSTYWIVAGRSLGDVLSVVRTDAEITPPLYFVATWLTTRIDLAPELVRAPSLIAGIATIPLVYVLGLRTAGRAAGLVAAALTALSPFMVYYSAEARGYALMIALVVLSTIALLAAVDGGRARWWVAYGACACLAVYTHYTSVFALAAQLLWLLWAHPEARRPALLASAAAAIAFLPWAGGLHGDLTSATTDILSALSPLTWSFVRTSLLHWAIGYPYAIESTRILALPGELALVLLAVAGLAALAGLMAARSSRSARGARAGGLDRRLVLLVVLAVSVPLGTAVASAVGSNILGTRNLAASWPAFALCLAAFLVAGGPRLGPLAAALAIAAFAIGAVKLLGPDFRRPDFQGVAAAIDRAAAPADVVVDGAPFSPAGVPGALDAALERPHERFYLGRDEVEYDPFRILAPAPPTEDVIERAVAAAGGRRLFMAFTRGSPLIDEAVAALPPGYRRADERTYPGLVPLVLLVVERR
jgi:4-amino-4-deoxy-L-arabinose transferase-like glycosyltransferase